MESTGRSLLRTFSTGITEKGHKFLQLVSEPFNSNKTVDYEFEEKRGNWDKLLKLCKTVQEELSRHGDLKRTIADPLMSISGKMDEFFKEAEEKATPNLDKMKEAGVEYTQSATEIAAQIDKYSKRQDEFYKSVEQCLIQLELLRGRIIERDNLLADYDRAKSALKAHSEKSNKNLQKLEKAHKDVDSLSRRYEEKNTKLLYDIAMIFNTNYTFFKEEYRSLMDVQIQMFNMIERSYKHLGEAMNMNTEHLQQQIREKATQQLVKRLESKKQEHNGEEVSGTILPTAKLEQYIEEAKRSPKLARKKEIKQLTDNDYEGRVVPLCRICKKEVPIEFIDEHSSVCSAYVNDDSVLVEEALWIEHIEALEMHQFAPERTKFKPIKKLMRTIGVPDKLRPKIWPLVINISLMKNNKDNHTYDELHRDSAGKTVSWADEIERDLQRTFPKEEIFQTPEKLAAMRNVLNTYAYYNPLIGYCQSMNFIVAILLKHLCEEDAFWTLVTIIDQMLPENYYTKAMIGIQTDQNVFKHLLAYYFPKIGAHLRNMDVDIQPILVRWFLCLFVSVFPLEGADRLFELFLYEGDIMLFRFGLAIFKLHENALLQVDGMTEMFNFLQNVTKITNYKKLVHIAFQFKLKKAQVSGIRKRFLLEITKEEQERQEKKMQWELRRQEQKKVEHHQPHNM